MAFAKSISRKKAPNSVDWRRLRDQARRRFGIEQIRPQQREIMEAALAGHSVLGILPTGAGKSLCFQLPSLLLPHPVVVVSPLIALMQDQQAHAEDASLTAARIDSTLLAAERKSAAAQVESGEANLIYATPEQLEKPEFRKQLRKAGVSLLVVDEAHCISQWGHDFRPAYLSLKNAIRDLGGPPVMALTATATHEVVNDILEQLGLARALIVNDSIERENLFFEVLHTSTAEKKQAQLLEKIEQANGCGIVYCATVRAANELYEWLREQGVQAGHYHGRLPKKERAQALDDFMENRFRVVVATKAFGLGIDKPDVRYVAHYQFPDSLESYYQEAGRAGRDGKPARCTLLYRTADKRVQTYFMLGKYPPAAEAANLFAILQKRSELGGCAPVNLTEVAAASGVGEKRAKVIANMLVGAELATRARGGLRIRKNAGEAEVLPALHEFERLANGDRERLDQMIAYAQSALCRVRLLKRYFGETADSDCGNCDNCLRKSSQPEITAPARDPHTVSIQTATVDLQTTAPEALPLRAPKIHQGDQVRHRKFGVGEVISAETDSVEIEFVSVGKKLVKPRFVRKLA
ncbi:MAG: ATP-dependent DNA helicase RecQ [Acidobacteriaceae bacterium]